MSDYQQLWVCGIVLLAFCFGFGLGWLRGQKSLKNRYWSDNVIMLARTIGLEEYNAKIDETDSRLERLKKQKIPRCIGSRSPHLFERCGHCEGCIEQMRPGGVPDPSTMPQTPTGEAENPAHEAGPATLRLSPSIATVNPKMVQCMRGHQWVYPVHAKRRTCGRCGLVEYRIVAPGGKEGWTLKEPQ